MSFRGGYDGTKAQAAFGPRLDALVAKLEGRLNRALIYDFRRSDMRTPAWPNNPSNLAASIGATSMTITGLSPFSKIFAGDYLGGDGRPHIITDDALADASGNAVVNFKPPLAAAISIGAAIFGNPTGTFRLVSDDAGQNDVAVGDAVNFTLEFVEDL